MAFLVMELFGFGFDGWGSQGEKSLFVRVLVWFGLGSDTFVDRTVFSLCSLQRERSGRFHLSPC